MTPQFIKEYFDLKFKIDLSTKSRKRDIVEKRFIAFKITKELCNNVTLERIGKAYKRDHASVLHGLKKFNELKYQQSFLESLNIYESSKQDLRETFNLIDNTAENLQLSINELKQRYRVKFSIMIDKFHSVIRKKDIVINNLKNRKIIHQIAELDDKTFKDLETRINAFLIMNKSN